MGGGVTIYIYIYIYISWLLLFFAGVDAGFMRLCGVLYLSVGVVGRACNVMNASYLARLFLRHDPGHYKERAGWCKQATT